MCPLASPARCEEQPHSPTPSSPHSLTGTFRIHEKFHSRFLPTDRTLIVYLPSGYEENRKKRYPVLYLQDGQNLFDRATSFVGVEWRADETAQSLIEAGTVEPLLIVGIYNAGAERIREYTPTRMEKYHAGGGANLYGRFLVEEVKPFIDREYRTKRGPKDTGLGGSSLGGLVSLYLGLKYPKSFGKLAVLSPSVFWDDRRILREVEALPRKPKVRIWLDMGTSEGRDAEGSAEAVSDTRRLRDALLRKDWRLNKDLSYFEDAGASHNEAAWAGRFGAVLKFLFPRK